MEGEEGKQIILAEYTVSTRESKHGVREKDPHTWHNECYLCGVVIRCFHCPMHVRMKYEVSKVALDTLFRFACHLNAWASH